MEISPPGPEVRKLLKRFRIDLEDGFSSFAGDPGTWKKMGGTHSALFLGVSFYIYFETSFLIPFFNFKGFDGCWVFWRCCGGTSWRVLNSWIFQLYFCIYKMVFSFLMFSDGKPHDLGCMSCILLVICLERRKPQLGMVRKLAKEIQTSVMLGSNTIHRWDVYAHGSSKDSVHLAFKFSGSWTRLWHIMAICKQVKRIASTITDHKWSD